MFPCWKKSHLGKHTPCLAYLFLSIHALLNLEAVSRTYFPPLKGKTTINFKQYMAVFIQHLNKWDSRDTVECPHPAMGTVWFIHRPESAEKAKISVVVMLLGTTPRFWRSAGVLCPETPKNLPWGFPMCNSSCLTVLLSVSRTDSHGQYLVCVCLSAANCLSTGTGITLHGIKVKIYSLTRDCSAVVSILSFVLAASIWTIACSHFEKVTFYVSTFKKLAKKMSRIALCTLLHIGRLRTSLTSFQK